MQRIREVHRRFQQGEFDDNIPDLLLHGVVIVDVINGLVAQNIITRNQANAALAAAGVTASYGGYMAASQFQRLVSKLGSGASDFVTRITRGQKRQRLRGLTPEGKKIQREMTNIARKRLNFDDEITDMDAARMITKSLREVTLDFTSNNALVAMETDNIEIQATGDSQSNNKGSETKITRFEKPTYGIPETFTVFHTYHDIMAFQLPTADAQDSVRLVLRMNSIYDIIANSNTLLHGGTPTTPLDGTSNRGTIASSGDPSIATSTTNPEIKYIVTNIGDPVEVRNNQPSYRAYYADKYKYYSVLGCDWKIHTYVRSKGADNYQAAAFTHYHGSIDPPNNAKYKELLYWKDFEGPHIIYEPTAAFPYANTTLKGRYKTGEHHEIVDDDTATIWTKSGENAKHPEFLSVYFCRHPQAYNSYEPGTGNGTAFGYNRPAHIRAQLHLSYLVQWKDLQYKWRYFSQEAETPGSTPAEKYAEKNTLAEPKWDGMYAPP